MSGGDFDHTFYKIDYFIEKLEKEIKNNSQNSNFSEDTIDNLKRSGQLLQLCSDLTHDIEWLYSGDDGEETFNDNCEEIFKHLKKFKDE